MANANDGNYILFHTDCTVISNNFRLSEADERKIAEIDTMMRLSPEQLRMYEPRVKYLLLRANDFLVSQNGQPELDASIPLARLLRAGAVLPDGFELIGTIRLERDGKSEVYARAFVLN